MYYDFNEIKPELAYRLLTATINPRPIAWITSMSNEGIVNAAPFSFFNIMGHNPPTVAIGIMANDKMELKDTANNILSTQEFVINLVSENVLEAMNQTCSALPHNTNELEEFNIPTKPATQVKPPLIKNCAISLECTTLSSVITGPNQVVVIGKVLAFHIEDQLLLDPSECFVDTPQIKLISRMHGSGWYSRSTDLFNLDRP